MNPTPTQVQHPIASAQSPGTANQTAPQNAVDNDLYMRIWEGDMQYMKTRWTVSTFFMSISFGIFAFSFQDKFNPASALAIRITALLIYWFSLFMYLHFYQVTKSLRAYLTEMEQSGQTTIHMQGKVWSRAFKEKILIFHSFRTHTLLIVFGIIYTIGIVVLQLLGI